MPKKKKKSLRENRLYIQNLVSSYAYEIFFPYYNTIVAWLFTLDKSHITHLGYNNQVDMHIYRISSRIFVSLEL